VVSDLLGPQFEAEIVATLPFEPRLGGFDNQSSALFVSPTFQEATVDVAESVASAIDPAALAPCAAPEGSAECLNDFVNAFATKAYGRPPTAEEVERITTAAATGEDYATSVRLAVEVILQSPYFLYVSELGSNDAAATPGQAVALTPYETASQLSLLLLGSRPDEELLEAASSGALVTPAEIRAQAERLLAQPEATEQLTRFVTGWLDMGPIADAPKNPDVFPDLTEAVIAAMQQEYDSFIRARLTSGQGTLTEFMTAQSADIPSALQPVYGADYDPATGLDPAHRSGVLSLPGLLTYHSADQHSGPVERGLFVRRQLLCQTVPPPPQAVRDQLAKAPIDFDDTVQTTRQKYEIHVNQDSCATCHLLFDPIGFGLEEFDGMGRFRTTENGLPVDSTGELLGTDVDGTFEGATELSQKLEQSQMFQACMVQHFFRFSVSRPAETTDACAVDAWTNKFVAGGGKLTDLVLAYVDDPMFNQRRDDR
jgi:hypothetical protein